MVSRWLSQRCFGVNKMRYIAEHSGAVLDTKTGLREWFNLYREAIEIAKERNK